MTVFRDVARGSVRAIGADELVFNSAVGKIWVGALAETAGPGVQMLMQFTIAMERHSWELQSHVGRRTYRKTSSQTMTLFGAFQQFTCLFLFLRDGIQ